MLDIHQDILFHILLYLPVMSLLRFKSVCKSWFSLIESSAFINEHLKYNSRKEDNLIVLYHRRDFGPNKSVVESVLHSGSQYEDCAYIDFDRLLWHPLNEDIRLSGSCNGIVCLQKRRTLDVALWNPALKQLRPLPPPLFSSRSVKYEYLSYAYGAFGIDGKTNDYKVLKIFPIISEEYGVVSNQVEVYSFRDNCWRIIHENIVLPFLETCQFDVALPCSNGKCFWLHRHGDHSDPDIITFDFTDEVFGTMSLPDREYDHYDPCKLDIYDDKFIYIRLREDHNNLKLEIWMRCEGGLKESWTKIYMTEPLPPLDMTIDPVGLFKNGEYFICQIYCGLHRLCLYNLHTREGKFLGFNPVGVIHYNPSLVSVKSVNEI